jgi:hypothetical protein
MKKKPLLFIALALAHFLEPIIKLIYFKMTTSFSFATIINNISQIQSTREVFDFWLLFPLGGFALITVKKWSYPIFVGVQAYSIFSHLTYEQYTWPYVSEFPFISSLAILTMNALIIFYFALPDVRKPFFDKSIRWWETRKRYSMRIPMNFAAVGNKRSYNCDILNISQSGVFLGSHHDLEVGTDIKMNILYKDYAITVIGQIKSHHNFENEQGFGVKFRFENIWENLYMRKVVRQISKDTNQENKQSTSKQDIYKESA